MVDTLASYDEMRTLLVGHPLRKAAQFDLAAFDLYRQSHDFSKTILISNSSENDLYSLAVMTDLTSIQVSNDLAEGLQENAEFAVLTVRPESVYTRIKNVDL